MYAYRCDGTRAVRRGLPLCPRRGQDTQGERLIGRVMHKPRRSLALRNNKNVSCAPVCPPPCPAGRRPSSCASLHNAAVRFTFPNSPHCFICDADCAKHLPGSVGLAPGRSKRLRLRSGRAPPPAPSPSPSSLISSISAPRWRRVTPRRTRRRRPLPPPPRAHMPPRSSRTPVTLRCQQRLQL